VSIYITYAKLNSTIARLAGLTERGVTKALRGLEKAGRITTRRGCGLHHPNVYHLIKNGEPGFSLSGPETVNGRVAKGEPAGTETVNGGSPEGSMKEERGGAASPPVDATGTNPPPEDPAHGNGAGGRVIALWCQGHKLRTGTKYASSAKGRLAGTVARLLTDFGEDQLTQAVGRWFGADRQSYSIGLFERKLTDGDADLTGRAVGQDRKPPPGKGGYHRAETPVSYGDVGQRFDQPARGQGGGDA